MIRQLSIVILTSFMIAGNCISQNDSNSVNKTVHTSDKATFGTSKNAVSDYLTAQDLLPQELPAFKRAAFRLIIDDTGRVTEASKFFGSISPELDTQLAQVFVKMPNWKTTISDGDKSVVYVVVTIENRVITTELY